MAKVFICLRMALAMKVIGIKASEKDGEFTNTQMEVSIRVIMIMGFAKVKGYMNTQTMKFTKVIGRKIKRMDMELQFRGMVR